MVVNELKSQALKSLKQNYTYTNCISKEDYFLYKFINYGIQISNIFAGRDGL